MLLRPPPWADECLQASSSSSSSSSSSASSALTLTLPPPSPAPLFPSPVSDLVLSLTNRRLYREIALSLRTGLCDARAEFSFLRVKGLNALAKLLAVVPQSDTLIHLFQESQRDQALQVVPVLFKHSLAPPRSSPLLPADPVSCEEPPQVISPPNDYEVAFALRVLEGCCLLDRASRFVAAQHMAVKEVIELLSAGGVSEQSACLDALLALMLDTTVNQEEFVRNQGLRKISELVKNGHVDEKMRLKCAEFLLLLVGSVLPSGTVVDEEDQGSCFGEEIQQELLAFFGIDLVSFSKEADQIVTSFADTKGKQNYLHLQAKQLLDSLDSNNVRASPTVAVDHLLPL